jgi:hypothetical protein
MTDLKDLWPIPPLSEAAKARMIARAVAAPQLRPWPQTVITVLERALSEWRYGLAYKLAAAAACVALGLGIGLNFEPREHDVLGLAFMSSMTAQGGEVSE